MGQYWKSVWDLGYQEMSVNNFHVWHSIRKIGYMQVKRMMLSVGHTCVLFVRRVTIGHIIWISAMGHSKCLNFCSRCHGVKRRLPVW